MNIKRTVAGVALLTALTGSLSALVTVTDYQGRLRDSYVSIGVPTTIVDQVLPIDVEIYNARVAGDTTKVRELVTRRASILSPTYVTKVHEYFVAHPYVVDYGTGTFTVWVDDFGNEVVAEPGEVITVDVYRQRLHDSYIAIGLPETVIVQLLPIDVEIYNAYATGNVTLVSELQQRRVTVVPAPYVEKVQTYFTQHPVRVKTEKTTFSAWETKGTAPNSSNAPNATAPTAPNSSSPNATAPNNPMPNGKPATPSEPNPKTVGPSSPNPREGQPMEKPGERNGRPQMNEKMPPTSEKPEVKPATPSGTNMNPSTENKIPQTGQPIKTEKSGPAVEKMNSAAPQTNPAVAPSESAVSKDKEKKE